MPQRIMTELWDYIAQQFRDTLDRCPLEAFNYRLSPDEYSIGETAWRALGSCYQWSAVLSGATSAEDVIADDPSAMDFLQASSYPPCGFPESMTTNQDVLLSRTDDLMAVIAAQFMELPATARSKDFETFKGASYTGDEIVARIIHIMSYSTGQMRLLINHAQR